MGYDGFYGDIKSIFVKIGGFFQGVEMRKAYIDGKTAILKRISFDGSQFSEEEIERMPQEEFIEKLGETHMEAWKKRYYDNEILDGEQWEIVLEYEGKKKSYRGNNQYPDTFDVFLTVMRIDLHL